MFSFHFGKKEKACRFNKKCTTVMYSRSKVIYYLRGCSFKRNPPFICMQFATNVSLCFWITKEA